MYPGEYPQPLVRKTQVHCPIVSGYSYVTCRLKSQENSPLPLSGGNFLGNMLVTFENVGNTYISFLLRETNDRSISGMRYNLTATPIGLVPGGVHVSLYSNKLNILEVWCQGTNDGKLRMQIDSVRKWEQMAFSKDDPYYPPSLYIAKTVPGPLPT